MDLRYYLQATEAAAPAVHAADDDVDGDGVPQLAPKAVLLKLEVQVQGVADETAARQGESFAAAVGVGAAEAGKVAEGGGGSGRDLTCPECGKAFLSDKAMYGHLRSHPERGYKGATRPTTTTTASGAAGDKRPRKAPRMDGEWSSAISKTAAAAATAEKKKPWEGAELETKWSVKAKRGRAPSTPSVGSASLAAAQVSGSEEEAAAKILLEMASGCSAYDASSGNQTAPSVEQPIAPDHAAIAVTPEAEKPPVMQPVRVSLTAPAPQMLEGLQVARPEHTLEASAESQTPPEVKQLAKVEPAREADLFVAGDKSTPPRQPSAAGTGGGGGSGGAKKQYKKRRVVGLELSPAPADAADVKPPPPRRIPSPASDKKYECPTCHKSFPSHQALGGHMASHVKVRHGARHNDHAAMAQAAHNVLAHQGQGGGGGGGGIDVIAGAGAGQQVVHDVQPPAPAEEQIPVPHVCNECQQSFGSGQALGGHKRKHWLPEKKQRVAAAQAARAAATRDFDLNELPKEAQGENQP
ncbi:hypothetical protein ACP4OV_024353 [Aristida adscensionis]